ncbi:hypothetical protein [Neobacillus bataviensis]|nr:hypothetical protein [Neobacillus bataviensis]
MGKDLFQALIRTIDGIGNGFNGAYLRKTTIYDSGKTLKKQD